MTFFPKAIKKRMDQERKARTDFAEYLKNRIRAHQERLDTEEFEDEDEAVHLTQHVQRLRMIIEELESQEGS